MKIKIPIKIKLRKNNELITAKMIEVNLPHNPPDLKQDADFLQILKLRGQQLIHDEVMASVDWDWVEVENEGS